MKNADFSSQQNDSSSTVRPSRWTKLVKQILIGTIAIYGSIILYLILNETSLVYPGGKPDATWDSDFPHQEVWVDSTDGTRIHGWLLPKENASRHVLLMHGNAEDVPQVADRYARKIGEAMNANVLVFDYRGFGQSTGTPYEKGVIDDSEAMLDWFLDHLGLKEASDGVIYFGSSLGGGVAVGLAERRKPKHLVLDRTFDSITSAGSERYPWIPVRMMMRNRFDSAIRIQNIDVPLFQSHFTQDELCSIEGAKKVFSAAPTNDKTFYEMPEGTHYVPLPPDYWVKLKDYFDSRDQTFVDEQKPSKNNVDVSVQVDK